MTTSAYKNKVGVWVYPQLYYQNGKPISKKKLLEQIYAHPLVKEAMLVDSRVRALIEQAKQQQCAYGYNRLDLFYDRYKPRIVNLVGWDAQHKALRTTQHYDAVYEAIEDLLPADDADLYPEGIMPNGMYSPNFQEKYGREYP